MDVAELRTDRRNARNSLRKRGRPRIIANCLSSSVSMFSFDYPPNDGGVARLCAEIAKGLAASGKVHVLTQAQAAPGADAPNLPETRVTARRPLRELAGWWHLLRRRREGAVLAGIWYPEGLLALLARRRPLVILAHGAELTPPQQPWRRELWAWMQRQVLERADLVIANSAYTARCVSAVAPQSRVKAIPLAVDHCRFSSGDRGAARAAFGIHDTDAIVISTVARIHPYKGIDVVLNAIAALPPDFRARVVYLIGGKGPAIAPLREEARRLGIADQVRWLGFVPEDQLPDLYRASNLFALCTRETLDDRSVEGFGLVFLEAQACATPVVGTRIGGIPDAIREGEGGWLIDQDDVPALADLLRHLLHDPASFHQAGLAARRRVERECTWDTYITRLTGTLAAEGIGID